MINEFIFILQTFLIGIFALSSLRLGKEALIGFIALQAVLANLFVVKQTVLFGLNATTTDAFAVGGALGLNLLQEYYGRDMAKKAIWISFFLLVFYGIFSQIHLAYLPSAQDLMHHHFMPILSFMPRIVIASFTAYLISQQIESWLYARLKLLTQGRYLVARNYTSIMASQLIDTILFSFLGLYGIIDNIGHIILISYIIKMATMMVATPFIAFSKKIIKPVL